ncbi:PPE domain-containing protein [Amycolatopsis sp. NPDC059090]|uniref:PPE domain-containing protein n=1 Tax=unclassified Amycolatopsis TaxID=2618356 RepID=UPI00366FC669
MAGRSLTPAEIYHLITEGPGPESLGNTQQAAKELSERLLDRADEIASLVEKVRAGWQGASAEEAANSAAPLLAASVDHSANLVFAQNAADGQLSAFQAIKNTVRPVGDRPEITAQDVYDSLNGRPGYFGKLDQWQADAQHNVDAYTGYHSTTGTNSDRIPARYAELNDTGASVELASTSISAPPKPVEGPGGPSGKPPDSHRPDAIEPPPGADVPKPRAPMPEPSSDHPMNHPSSGELDATKSRPQTAPSEATPAPGTTRISSFTPSSAALPPGYQFGPSGQSINPLGTSGFDPEPGTGGSTNQGFGAGNRIGARAPDESVPARGSTAGTPGTAGKSGKPGTMLGSGIPGKNREEDKEKTAPPYLRETDPDVFGTSDLKPTPPVIGDRPAD